MKKLNQILTVFIVLLGSFVLGQSTLNLQSADLRISGTSTLHDWEMKSSKATGTMRADVSSSSISAISDINVNMPAKSLKSGKGGMDDKAYDAIKANKYSQVRFDLTSAKKSGRNWILQGNFTFAGKKKAVSLKAYETTTSGVVTLKGNYSFKLTDYGIDPPTAMFGTIKTGNAVKITYTVKFK